MKTAKVKFLHEIEAVRQGVDIDDESRDMSLTVCECMNCHWMFIGDCVCEGYGYEIQGQQIPNYCPMCGSKFDDDLL